jgi:hypothetical protein
VLRSLDPASFDVLFWIQAEGERMAAFSASGSRMGFEALLMAA